LRKQEHEYGIDHDPEQKRKEKVRKHIAQREVIIGIGIQEDESRYIGHCIDGNYLQKTADIDGKCHFFPLDREEKQGVKISSVFKSGKLKKRYETGHNTENRGKYIESAGTVLNTRQVDAVSDYGLRDQDGQYGKDQGSQDAVFDSV
jgi:hypothetical protein